MARNSTRKRIESKRAQRERQKQMRLIIGVAVVAVVVVAAVIVLTRPRNVDAVVDTTYEGIPQEVDESGTAVGFALGEPDAPVTIVEYSDFSCPHCYNLSGPMEQIVEDYVREGDARVVFKPITFVNPPYSRPAAQAAICAGYQGKFWEMHNQLWALYEGTGPGAYTPGQLNRMAQALALDMAEYEQCYGSSDVEAQIEAVLTEAGERGVTGTPTIFVNGQEVPYRGPEVVYDDLAVAIEAIAGGE